MPIKENRHTYLKGMEHDADEDISPDSVSLLSRKESHRASEKKRREKLGYSMSTLDAIIRNTRKFANKRNVKLDKNSIIEHAIAYIRELQQVNEIYSKRLEEKEQRISQLQGMLNHCGQPYYTSNSSTASRLPYGNPVPYSVPANRYSIPPIQVKTEMSTSSPTSIWNASNAAPASQGNNIQDLINAASVLLHPDDKWLVC